MLRSTGFWFVIAPFLLGVILGFLLRHFIDPLHDALKNRRRR